MRYHRLVVMGMGCLAFVPSLASANCNDISRSALQAAVAAAQAANTAGYGLNMWVTMVDETGAVCHVVNSGSASGDARGHSGDTWLGSRVISAQKANTANAFSLDGYTISTANLYSAVQPGGSLFGLQHSNPINSEDAYQGQPSHYGTAIDPLNGKRIGGVNVFGGGLALYKGGKKIGAIGVSGDTSCTDHAYAWTVRHALGANPVAGMAGGKGVGITTVNLDAAGALQTAIGVEGDEMVQAPAGAPVTPYWAAWSHPACPNNPASSVPTAFVTY